MVKRLFLGIVFTFIVSGLMAQSSKSDTAELPFQLKALAEMGYLAVLDHDVQFSRSGTDFDYRESGGQDVLFPFARYSLEFQWKKKNTLYFLYQPLRLETQVLLQEDLVVDGLTFPARSNVNLLYNFPFYRISYTRELLSDNPDYELALGGSLQLRNATISFESGDGTLYRTNRDLGPVPALKLKTRAYFTERFFGELEADGIYAPISYLNGSDNEVEGAILDASLRFGVEFDQPVTAFLNARYLGGGAVGTSDIDGPGDGYIKNWLDFFTVSVGFTYTLQSQGESCKCMQNS